MEVETKTKDSVESPLIQVKFALEGLSCSSCVHSVDQALRTLSASQNKLAQDRSRDDDDPSNNNNHETTIPVEESPQVQRANHVEYGIIDESISISLFPEPNLDVLIRLPPPSESTSTANNNNTDQDCKNEKQMTQEIIQQIMNCIEDIGFGITFESQLEIIEALEEDNLEGQDGNIHHNGKPRLRTIRIQVEHHLQRAYTFFDESSNVSNVSIIETNDGPSTTTSTPLLNNNSVGGTIQFSFQPNDIGIRTLLSQLESFIQNNQQPLQHVLPLGQIKVMDAMGYHELSIRAEQRRQKEIREWRNDFLIALVLAVPVFCISMIFVHIPGGIKEFWHGSIFWNVTQEEFWTWVLTTPVQFYSGARFYRDAYYSIKTRHLGMGFLIAMGTSAAYFYSIFAVLYNASRNAPMKERLMQAFETSALLIMFVLLGKYLEAMVKSVASKAISELTNLTPDTATLVGTINEQEQEEVLEEEEVLPLVMLQRNDVLLVRPGEKVPIDGEVIHGITSIDESMITGESMPVMKAVGDDAIGGTINLDGLIRVRVKVVGEDTTLAKIIQLVERAQSSKAPIQEYADLISSRFVPIVTGISAFSFVFWVILLNTGILSERIKESWSYRDDGLNEFTLPLLFSISVLVIACPCALGLATPTAVMVGSGVGAKLGILIKGGEALEVASKVNAVVFDKTGTLTIGSPKVEDILLLSDRAAFLFSDEIKHESLPEDLDEKVSYVNSKCIENIVFLAACAEYGSEHPLAKGVLAQATELGIGEGQERPLVPVENFKSTSGSGIQCEIEDHLVHIGNRRSLEQNKIEITTGTYEAMKYLENRGRTAIVVSVDGKSEAVIGLMDKARDEASLIVNVLQQDMKIKCYMLTGDNRRTAEKVASDIGISSQNIIADVLPEGKVNCIEKLQAEGHTVAMIGDGVNDSPALAKSDVGIAIGAGTDVAIETSKIVLVNSKLTDVLVSINLSRVIFQRIKLNFVWALGYNSLAIPIAAGSLYPVFQMALPPFMAAIAMILSSLSVICSSLLLNRYTPPQYEKIYGRRLREGRLGLESIIIAQSPSKEVNHINVKLCKSMADGGKCACLPSECECFGCEEHNLTQPSAEKSFKTYPGCASLWGDACKCIKCACSEVGCACNKLKDE